MKLAASGTFGHFGLFPIEALTFGHHALDEGRPADLVLAAQSAELSTALVLPEEQRTLIDVLGDFTGVVGCVLVRKVGIALFSLELRSLQHRRTHEVYLAVLVCVERERSHQLIVLCLLLSELPLCFLDRALKCLQVAAATILGASVVLMVYILGSSSACEINVCGRAARRCKSARVPSMVVGGFHLSALVRLNEVPQHNVLSLLGLLDLIESFGHVEHLHLDQLKVDFILIRALALSFHLSSLLSELAHAMDHLAIAIRHIFELSPVIEVDQVFVDELHLRGLVFVTAGGGSLVE